MQQLSEVLYTKGKPPQPIVVACAGCQMTMWSTSETARVAKDGKILCKDCAEGE